MSEVAPILKPPSRSDRYVQLARFVRVFSATEFKLKYGESALGYLWTLAKPLAMFAILYFVFGHVVKIQVGFIDYPIYLLVGIVLWTFFVDATTSTMVSLIVEGSLLRKLRFPRIVIPVSTTMTATLTLLINLVAICVVIALKAIVPHGDWVLLLVLLLELYFVALGVGLILAILYVRFRDMAPIWELTTQLLFYASPIIYPLSILPLWAQRIELLNPVAQLTEDIRRILLYRDSPGAIVTAPDVLGTVGRLYPLGIALALLVGGLLLFRRDEPDLAEMI